MSVSLMVPFGPVNVGSAQFAQSSAIEPLPPFVTTRERDPAPAMSISMGTDPDLMTPLWNLIAACRPGGGWGKPPMICIGFAGLGQTSVSRETASQNCSADIRLIVGPVKW